MLKVDDSLDVFGVHAVGGILGALLTGVFNSPALGGPSFPVDWFVGTAVPAQDLSIAPPLWVPAKGGRGPFVSSGVRGRVSFKLVVLTLALRARAESRRQ